MVNAEYTDLFPASPYDNRLGSLLQGHGIANALTIRPRIVKTENGIAYIGAKGPLETDLYWGYSSYYNLRIAIESALADDEIKGIVFMVNSPGGNVNGLFDCGRFLLEAREIKPILAVVEHMAASAAYLLASCCTRVSMSPYSEAGSCGIETSVFDTSKWDKEHGFITKIFHSANAKLKNLDPLTEEGEAELQKRLDYLESAYFDLVSEGRGMDKEKCIETFGHGLMYPCEKAVEIGMADEIATADDAIEKFISSLAEDDEDTESMSYSQNFINSSLDTESEGDNMQNDKKTESVSLNADQIRAEAVAAERTRVAALNALRKPCTEAIVDEAIKSGASVADTQTKVIEALSKRNDELEVSATAIKPIKDQADAQDVVGAQPTTKDDRSVEDEAKAAIEKIKAANKEMEDRNNA